MKTAVLSLRTTWAAWPAIVLFFSLAPSTAHAARYEQDISGGAGRLSDTRDTPFFLRSSGTHTYTDPTNYGSVSSLAYSDAGMAGVAASASMAGSTHEFVTNTSADASSSFSDSVVIDDPELNGTTGTVKIGFSSAFRVLGLARGAYAAHAAGSWSEFFGSSGGASDSFQFLFGQGNGSDDTPYMTPGSLTSPFVFGHSFTASLNAFAGAGLSTQDQSQFATIGHAIGFTKILEIRDADGNIVPFASGAGGLSLSPSRATVSSESGIDYTIAHGLPQFDLGAEAADFDGDGKVDIADLGLLASHWQQSGTSLPGDANDDGRVDIADLGILASNWQYGVSGSPQPFADALASLGLPSVPEPANLGLLTLGLPFIRKNRRS